MSVILRCVLLASMVIKYICTKAPKSSIFFCSQAGPIPAPFLHKLFCLFMKPLHPSTPPSLSWAEGAGHR